MENIFFMWWDLVSHSLPEPGEVEPADRRLRQQYYALLLPALFSEDAMTDRERSAKIRGLKGGAPAGFKYFFGQWSESAVSRFRSNQLPIYNAIFEALKEILELDAQHCQSCALHGLGHLNHTGRADLLQGFIDRHQEEFDANGLEWVEQCRDGMVM